MRSVMQGILKADRQKDGFLSLSCSPQSILIYWRVCHNLFHTATHTSMTVYIQGCMAGGRIQSLWCCVVLFSLEWLLYLSITLWRPFFSKKGWVRSKTSAGIPTVLLSPDLTQLNQSSQFRSYLLTGTSSSMQTAGMPAVDTTTDLLPCPEIFLYFYFYTWNINHDFHETPATAAPTTWHCSPQSSEDSGESTLSNL